MNVKNNRKSKLTKKILKDTLIELLEKNHIAEISVKKLCESADLNRSTFYSHYSNQMELLKEVEEETYAELKKFVLLGKDKGSESIMTNLLNFIKNNPLLFKVLLGTNGNTNFREMLENLTKDFFIADGSKSINVSGIAREYSVTYRISGYAAVIERWLMNNFEDPVDQMVVLLLKLSGEE